MTKRYRASSSVLTRIYAALLLRSGSQQEHSRPAHRFSHPSERFRSQLREFSARARNSLSGPNIFQAYARARATPWPAGIETTSRSQSTFGPGPSVSIGWFGPGPSPQTQPSRARSCTEPPQRPPPEPRPGYAKLAPCPQRGGSITLTRPICRRSHSAPSSLST